MTVVFLLFRIIQNYNRIRPARQGNHDSKLILIMRIKKPEHQKFIINRVTLDFFKFIMAD
ncbi:MAG: hypothetical protein A2W93_11050 [Bacteroidetes bacterium GWF2_43_63]|nr:MAG: hypothetical protein A2W94_13925 [Bacteroidetes bacterium GWE2_42_42]OFY54814.1 MAG: hypothetical protein A2W93_11050 [Bacteroidetes bacterium GWF2_43_63]HCB63287.1 hypothetical protein [Bacteroidales bacterium]HCY22029.1 hypothetical protein [Bacteroidales bacterium]